MCCNAQHVKPPSRPNTDWLSELSLAMHFISAYHPAHVLYSMASAGPAQLFSLRFKCSLKVAACAHFMTALISGNTGCVSARGRP